MFAGIGHAPGTTGFFPTPAAAPVLAPDGPEQHPVTAEVPLPTVQVLDALQLPLEDDAFYKDDQYQDDYSIYEGP